MKIFIDTNVWLRFLLADVKEQYQECVDFFIEAEAGRFRPYTSTIVLLEVHYVLTSLLKISQEKVLQDIECILETRNLTLIEKTDFRKALKVYRKTKIKFADCLIATQLPKEAVLCTFDKEFRKVKTLKTITPGEYSNLE
ncbi:PIN domain-containing protein [Patescibacteria group bacterium]|nr:PIN domain-containing protein [Patescibacteria group bacterium]